MKSFAWSACVSPQTTHFQVLEKSTLSGPGRGTPSCRHHPSWSEKDRYPKISLTCGTKTTTKDQAHRYNNKKEYKTSKPILCTQGKGCFTKLLFLFYVGLFDSVCNWNMGKRLKATVLDFGWNPQIYRSCLGQWHLPNTESFNPWVWSLSPLSLPFFLPALHFSNLFLGTNSFALLFMVF